MGKVIHRLALMMMLTACAPRVVTIDPYADAGAPDARGSPVDVAVSADVPVVPTDVPAPVDAGARLDVPSSPVDVPSPPVDVPSSPVGCTRSGSADLLFVVDNSNSMASNQANLARSFSVLIEQLASPPVVNGHEELTHFGHQKLTHPGSVSVAAHRVSVATS